MPSTSLSQHLSDDVDAIVDIFDRRLRYRPPDGKGSDWGDEGRARFRELVRRAVRDGSSIEFCLPAFPCKSTNLDKVAGPHPDRGEELALLRLHDFVRAVRDVYRPGATLTVVSDGFVFSDLVGRDDDDVRTYAEELDSMNESIGRRASEHTCVRFFPLSRMLGLETDQWSRSQCPAQGFINHCDDQSSFLIHPLRTRTTGPAELARRLMMDAFGGSRAELRRRIESGDEEDKGVLARYRGETRFMLHDLAGHQDMAPLSGKAKKRLASLVAFEMMMRNDAHSKLVDMMFPRHIRLSVHAHEEAGPKFAISLFGPDVMLTSHPDLAGSLHIATPWHNCIADVPGQGLVVTRSGALRRYAAAGKRTWKWVPRAMGGYFAPGTVTDADIHNKVEVQPMSPGSPRPPRGPNDNKHGG